MLIKFFNSNKNLNKNKNLVVLSKKMSTLSDKKVSLKNRFFKEPLNIVDTNSGISGIFSKDVTESSFNLPSGSNFQQFLSLNSGISHNRTQFSTNISFLNLNDLLVKKSLNDSNKNPLFFLFWEGVPRREITGLSVFIGNVMFSYGGLSCVLGARSKLLWSSLYVGGGRFKKLSYLSGRSGLVSAQRSNLYESSRTFFSSNSDNKGPLALNDFFSRMRAGGKYYDLHYSLAGLSFIENSNNLRNLKSHYMLLSSLYNKNKIKVNSILLGQLDNKLSKNLPKVLKTKNVYFLDSYKISGKVLKSFDTKTVHGFSAPAEYESTSVIKNIQGNLSLASKAITSKSQLISSFSVVNNVLINSFFSKLNKNLTNKMLNQTTKFNTDNNEGYYLELKNRIYGLLESKEKPLFNNNMFSQRNTQMYSFSETAAPFVQLNICAVDGPSRHSRTMSELNWALQLNTNFS